jgi:hypothetical protein
MRIGKDYESKRWIVHSDFYKEAIERTPNIGKLYLCYDGSERPSEWARDSCLKPFVELGAVVVRSNHPLDDFQFAMQFRRIAIAPSTFCWWASFLSEAELVFFPRLARSQTSCWGAKNNAEPFIRLEVDEPRYEYIESRTLWD